MLKDAICLAIMPMYIVCDGFTGNVILKLAESFYVITIKKGLKDEFFDRFNYEQYGGSPILVLMPRLL